MSSGLPEVSSLEDVQYVRDALLPGKSEPEATYAFTKYVHIIIHYSAQLYHYVPCPPTSQTLNRDK